MEKKESTKTFIGNVYAGFPSPAADYMEEDIDLKKYLQPNPSSIFVARVKGDSMMNANIPDNAIVVIDKSLKVMNGSVVIATLDGEKVIKHFVRTQQGTFLASANPMYKSVKILPEMDFAIWGVVTHSIVKLIN